MLVKRLLPLGFTRADIRKELYLSDGNPDQAASKLLAQQEQSERASSSLGDEETDEGGVGEEAQKSGEQEKKPFAIRSVVVLQVPLSSMLSSVSAPALRIFSGTWNFRVLPRFLEQWPKFILPCPLYEGVAVIKPSLMAK